MPPKPKGNNNARNGGYFKPVNEQEELLNQALTALETKGKEVDHYKQLAQQNAEKASDLQKRVDELSFSLSHEMSSKLSMDESDIENINQKNRPMVVAEEYDLMCGNSWLQAKDALDAFFPGTEKDLVTMLKDVLMEIMEIATKKYEETIADIYHVITVKAEMGVSNTEENTRTDLAKVDDTKAVQPPGPSQSAEGKKPVPDSLKVAIGDLLRQTCSASHIGGLVQGISKKFMDKIRNQPESSPAGSVQGEQSLPPLKTTGMQGQEALPAVRKSMTIAEKKVDQSLEKSLFETMPARNMHREQSFNALRQSIVIVESKEDEHLKKQNPDKALSDITGAEAEASPDKETSMRNIEKYLEDCASLCWKMAAQRPPMTFDDKTGIGEKWKGEKLQRVFFNSQDPTEKENVVLYYVYPVLKHNDRVLRPGYIVAGPRADKTKPSTSK